MLRPSYEDILRKINENAGEDKFDSKYSIVIAIAKRAREIILENDTGSDKIIKPVSKSIKDIYLQKVTVRKDYSEETEELVKDEDIELKTAPVEE